MGAWSPDSKTNVAHMDGDDFRSTERSAVMAGDGALRIELVGRRRHDDRSAAPVPVLAGEVVDASVMHVAALRAFLDRPDRPGQGRGCPVLGPPEGDDDEGLGPDHLRSRGAGLLPEDLRHATARCWPTPASAPTTASAPSSTVSSALADGGAIRASFDAELADGPALAMVDSDRGITNLHVPSDVIVDASMPAMIRTSGHMWGPDGKEADTLAVIPDTSYAGVYQVVIDDCRANGAFDPATMGSVPNVGLMAQAAEEYGSHDKTFEIPADGTVRVSTGPARSCSTAGRRRRHLPDVPDQGHPDPGLGQARRHSGPCDGRPGGLLARRGPCPRREPDREGPRVPARVRHRGPADRDHVARAGDRVLPRAHPRGREHHLGDRQRAARLPHRPVPDHGARDQRQDVVDRAR